MNAFQIGLIRTPFSVEQLKSLFFATETQINTEYYCATVSFCGFD